jgi:hypothetical protein
MVVKVAADKSIKIVFLLGAPLTEQNFNRLGIPYLSNHFEIVIFDCIGLLGRSREGIASRLANWPKYLIVDSIKDLDFQIGEFRPDYVIDGFGFDMSRTEDVLRIVEKYKSNYVVVKTGNLPEISKIDRMKNIFIQLFNKKKYVTNSGRVEVAGLSESLANKIARPFKRQLVYMRLNKFRPFIGLLAGNKAVNQYTARSNPIIWIGSNDYHTYSRTVKEMAFNGGLHEKQNFILFIDDCLPKADDFAILKLPAPVTEAAYYPALNRFFEEIESIYGMQVLIAGHPNSVSDVNYQSNMGNRVVEFGRTAELVINSSLVLIHGSTATSFAVLAKKPTIFLTSHELANSYYGAHVRSMAKTLGSPLVYIDDCAEQKRDLRNVVANEYKYSYYKDNFICNKQVNEVEPWGAFTDFVKHNIA